MSHGPIVLHAVVSNDLCIGCGICVQACPNDALQMQWNDYGFLVAARNQDTCDGSGKCIKVCPFNPTPSEGLRDENELATVFLKDALQQHEKIGRFTGIYVGYSKKFRATSSSGGVATYIFEQLLAEGIADHIITVTNSNSEDAHYRYEVISAPEGLLGTSKTRYYPVTLATAMHAVEQLDGKVAIAGVGCFIKAIRLAQAANPALKGKIAFLVGIICGGVKSRFFTEYLASKAGHDHQRISKPEYRIKDPQSTANDYSFGCSNETTNEVATIKMRRVGDMWGTGLFKANACDFCDDVTTELADISLGDAWIEPYSADGLGHNVIVTRSTLAQRLINRGIEKAELKIQHLAQDRFLASQQGSFNHRHDGLFSRLQEALRSGKKIPVKRHGKKVLPFDLAAVQKMRRYVRKKSLHTWREKPSADLFDKSMKNSLLVLRAATKLSRIKKRLGNKG